VRTEVQARGVSPDAAWQWWTDFRSGTEDHAFAAWAHPEREVAWLPDGRVRLRERAKVLGLRYEEEGVLELAKPRIRFEATNTFGDFRGHLRFLPGDGGTRIEVVWDMRLVRWLRWLGPLGRWGVRAFFAWDMRHHVRELEREAAR
jgi:hypothetical protein